MNQTKPTPPLAIDIYAAILLMGRWGSGKTSALATLPWPLIVDSFEESTKLLAIKYRAETVFIDKDTTFDEVKSLISSGKRIFIRSFGREKSRTPVVFEAWRRRFDADLKPDSDGFCFYDLFSTHAIDSLTGWNEACTNFIVKKMKHTIDVAGAKVPMETLAQGDYPYLYNEVDDMINNATGHNRHFVLTAHLDTDVDAVTGRTVTSLRAFKTLRTTIPSKMMEKLVMRRTGSGDKQTFELLTADNGKYEASTVLGAESWAPIEEPDFRKLFAKAGINHINKSLDQLIA